MAHETGLRSQVPGVVWPAIPDTPTATTLALAWQLERSQWWPADVISARQREQRDLVVAHAATTVPHYRGITDWASVPLLDRAAIVATGDALLSRGYPAAHGTAEPISTSRTSGAAVLVRGTAVTQMLWHAITLRDHVWHRRDLDASLAVIRYKPGPASSRGWGASTAILAPDAQVTTLDIGRPTDEQTEWLVAQAPAYLLTYPTVLDGILRRLQASGRRIPTIRAVRTISEALSPSTRELCREVLGVKIEDVYSAQEVGYIALQCPEHEHYHVQSERLFVEIVRQDGSPCTIGETGRVVVTDLHNYATPLLRYDLGDYAEVGAPCPCGRGLPVLNRILGRHRNLLVYPDGTTRWPLFAGPCRNAARYRAMQLVQPRVDALIARVVPDGEFTVRDRNALIAALHGALGYPFEISVELVDELGRSPGGKLDEFVSSVSSAGTPPSAHRT